MSRPAHKRRPHYVGESAGIFTKIREAVQTLVAMPGVTKLEVRAPVGPEAGDTPVFVEVETSDSDMGAVESAICDLRRGKRDLDEHGGSKIVAILG